MTHFIVTVSLLLKIWHF